MAVCMSPAASWCCCTTPHRAWRRSWPGARRQGPSSHGRLRVSILQVSIPAAADANTIRKDPSMKKILLVLAVLTGLAACYLLAWPTPIDPLAYQPPPGPALTGVLAPNTALRAAQHIGAGQLQGPEDTAVDAQGRIYGGTHDGRILRVT